MDCSLRIKFYPSEFFNEVISLGIGLSLSCSNFLKKLLQFSKKVAQKLLQNSKSCSKVAPKSKSFSKVAFYFWV